jgi:hypothetical protein
VMKDKPDKGQHQKKHYIKPEVILVPLRPDEAVLGNCKVSGSPVSSVSFPSNCEFCGGALGS